MLPCPKIPHTPAKNAVSTPSRSTYCFARKLVSACAIVSRRVFTHASDQVSSVLPVRRSILDERSRPPLRQLRAGHHLRDKVHCARRARRARLRRQPFLLRL